MDSNAIVDSMMAEMQMKDTVRMYNSLVERCFHNCVNDFSSTSLSSKETQCMYRCADKFIKFTSKSSRIFTEHSLLEQQKAQQEATPT